MKTFILAVKSGFINCFNFKGRATRAEYWYFFFSTHVLYLISLFITHLNGDINYFISVNVAVYILLLYLNIATAIRRLHDINKTGWWYLLIFIPIINIFIIFVFLYWFCKKGTAGDNNYGPPSTVLKS